MEISAKLLGFLGYGGISGMAGGVSYAFKQRCPMLSASTRD